MKSCCVIGGCGFIGRHLVEELLASGRKVTVVDAAPLPPGLAGKADYAGRAADRKSLVKILRSSEEVVDLAYASVPKTSFEEPVKDILSNLPFAVDLFQAACEASVKRLVVISSGGTVYGEPCRLPIPETHPTNPISPYGITKLAVEKYALMLHRLNGLPAIILRPGNAFGEGQRPFVGQGFIATAMASVLEGKTLTLFGRNGTVRDYIYVKDLTRGIAAALDRAKPGVCYNLGSGAGRSNREVLAALAPLARAAGLKPKVLIAPLRRFDVSANVLDSGKLKKETGWKLQTSFEDALARAWDWMLEAHGKAAAGSGAR